MQARNCELESTSLNIGGGGAIPGLTVVPCVVNIGEFLDEDCQQSPVAREAISAIYQRWRERAERRGEYVGTSRWLTQQLINRGFARTRLHGGAKALSGLSLKPREPGGYMPYRDD